jgi:hypothetical protein
MGQHMRVIRFDTIVFSPQYGAFAAGDVLRCGEGFAAHCVANLKAAHYVDAALSEPFVVVSAADMPAKPRKPRARSATH